MMQEPVSTMEEPAPKAAPRPFREIPALWLRIFSMHEDFFAAELPRAGSANTLLSILLMSLVAAIPAIVTGLRRAPATVLPTVCGSLVGGLGGALAGFYAGVGVMYVGARIFGGKGSFGGQAYLQSLYTVPIGIASMLVAFIPRVGVYLSVVVSIYGAVLTVRNIKVTHDLPTGKAIGAFLVPLALVFVLAVCLIVVLTLLGPAIGGVFEEIVNSI